MAEIKVKLAEGRSLFLPLTRIPMKRDKIYTVQAHSFWNRRLNDGDVMQVTSKSNKTETNKTETNESELNKSGSTKSGSNKSRSNK